MVKHYVLYVKGLIGNFKDQLTIVRSKAKVSCQYALFVVFMTNMLDNILLTSVVPIVPSLLLSQDVADLNHSHSPATNISFKNQSSTLTLSIDEIKTSVLLGNDLKPLLERYSNIHKQQEEHPTLQNPLKGNPPISLSALAFNENSRVGWLLSSKAIVQLFVNPFVGRLCQRVGYQVLLLSGTTMMVISSVLFSLANSYVPLFAARSIHGLGTATAAIAGMSILASHYSDDWGRSKAMGIAMGGNALGVVLGYPVGGIMNAFVGKTSVFMMLAGFLILDIFLQLFISGFVVKREAYEKVASFHVLLKDHYILLASGAVMLTTMSMSALEPTVPLWVMSTMHVYDWRIGLIFLPDSIGYWIGTNCFGIVARKIGRWIVTMGCMLLISLCLVCLPFASTIPQLILPHFGLGLGLGITDAAIMPMLALLVDLRHQSFYGCVYAIAQQAVCLAYSIGPLTAGFIVKYVGFSWFIRGIAVLNALYCPLCIILKNAPSSRPEDMPLTKCGKKDTETAMDETNFSYGRLHEDED